MAVKKAAGKRKKDAVAKTPKGGAIADSATFETDAGMGMENVGAEDMAIPFIQIAQGMSPQIKKKQGQYINGCEEGDIFNNVTQQLFKGEEGILLIPTAYKRTFVHWEPRDSGGGFLGVHDVAAGQNMLRETKRNEKGQDAFEDGSYLSDTRSFFILLALSNGVVEMAVINMSSTQIKKARQWLTRMNNLKIEGAKGMFTPPMFSQMWKLRTIPEENAKGSWFGWDIKHEGSIKNKELYQAAKEFNQQVIAGNVQTQTPRADVDEPDVPF